MARKRSSIKDKNVFKRSKALEDLIGSSNLKEEQVENMAEETEEKKEEVVSSPDKAMGAVAENDSLLGLSDEAAMIEGLPNREAELDLGELLDEETALATAAEEETFEDEFGLPPALETSPEIMDVDLPVGEAGLVADEDEFGFPLALETSSPQAAVESLPIGEADLLPDEDLFSFPPAMETSPSDTPVTELAMGEAGLDFAASVEPTSLPDTPDFPPAYDVSPGMAIAADLPLGEAGFSAAESAPIDQTRPGTSPAPTTGASTPDPGPAPSVWGPTDDESTLNEAAAPPPVDVASRPATPPPVTPASSGSTFAVSKRTPLTLDDDSPRDIFDFMGVADEPETIRYQIPEDVEELTPEERKRRMLLLKDKYVKEQFEKIYKAVDEEYEHILGDNVSSNQEITDWAHNLLAETRYILMNYQIEHLPKAEWNVQQVRARLDRAEESEKWRKKWAWPIIIWGLVWFFLFVILTFNPGSLLLLLTSDAPLMSELLVPTIFLRAVFFGGIGGVASVFFSLIKYTSGRSYDKEFNVSYFVKPFMGMIVGTLVYLLIYVVARPFGIVPTIAVNEVSPESNTLVFEVVTYFLALAAGFQEHIFFRILGRVMKIILRDEQKTEPSAPATAPPPGPFS